MPDDHSEVVPLLPIPNRTVKRLSADDSADARVKVGHRQADISEQSPARDGRALCFPDFEMIERNATCERSSGTMLPESGAFSVQCDGPSGTRDSGSIAAGDHARTGPRIDVMGRCVSQPR